MHNVHCTISSTCLEQHNLARNFINGEVSGRALAVNHTLADLRMLCTYLNKVKSVVNDIRIFHCSCSYVWIVCEFPLKFSRESTCRYGLVKLMKQVILFHNAVYIWYETKVFFSNTHGVVKQSVGDQLVD